MCATVGAIPCGCPIKIKKYDPSPALAPACVALTQLSGFFYRLFANQSFAILRD